MIDKQIRNSTAEFLIFTQQNGAENITVRYEDNEIWLTQKLIAQLFDCSTDNVSLHLKTFLIVGNSIQIQLPRISR